MTYMRTAADVQACIDAGLRAHEAGDLSSAINAYEQALHAAPANKQAKALLGTALLQASRVEEAVALLEQAARAERSNARLLGNLAHAYMQAGLYEQAHETFRKAGRIDPRELQFQVGSAAALALNGRLSEAESVLRRVLSRSPKFALAWFNLAHVLRDQQRFDESLAAYRKVLELEPNRVDARNGAGSVLHSLMRFAEAEAEYRACIEAAPEYLIARYNLASVTMDLGRFREAETICREIVARAPDDPRAHRLLGTALGHQTRLVDAVACYERASQIAPDDPQVAQAYGGALVETGRAGEGLRWLARALALAPQSAGLRHVVCASLLGQGRTQDGWSEYRMRPAALELRARYAALSPTESLAKDLSGKQVCVLGEQGLGDQLFFLRYAHELSARGARVSVQPATKIAGLLTRVSFISAIVPETGAPPEADVFVLAGDLPHALSAFESCALPTTSVPRVRTLLRDFDQRIAIFFPQLAPSLRIAASAEKRIELQQRLAACGPPPYIGVTWRGGTAPDMQQSETWLLYKHVSPSALARTLAPLPGTVLALQRKPTQSELLEFESALGRPLHDFSQYNDDLEGMLALLALIEEYVGVSNTNMHLRAAAGCAARVLVPSPAEWRWLYTGRSSPWFPGFAVYRQTLQGDWSAALAELGRDLAVVHSAATAPITR